MTDTERCDVEGADMKFRVRAKPKLATWYVAAVLVAGLIAVGAMAPLRGSAYGAPTVLRVERFVPVAVDAPPGGLMQSSAFDWSMASYGQTMFGAPGEVVAPQRLSVDSVAAAERELHRGVRVPRAIPVAIAGDPEVALYTAGSATYTLDLPKMHGVLADAGIHDLQLPTSLHEATIVATLPASLVLKWGEGEGLLMVMQARTPTVTVPGQVDLEAMRSLVLNYPAFSHVAPQLVAQVRSIEHWQTTLPVPTWPGQTAEPVRVDGSDGLLVRATRGTDRLIVWHRAGIVYGVGGNLDDDELLAVANSLR